MAADTFSINPGIVLRSEEEGAFLFDPDSGRICYINEVGITIWKQCKKPATLADIIDRVTAAYADVPAQKVTDDCETFLKNLETLGFLAPEA